MSIQTPQYTQDIREQFKSTGSGIGWPKKFFTFALFIFLSILLVYVGLAFGYESFLKNSIKKLDSGLSDLTSKISEEQRDNLVTLYSQVTNMRGLLKEHVFSSQALVFLESVTHPKVTYLSLDLGTEEGKASISGVTASYEDLVSQLAIFENSSGIEEYNLGNSAWSSGVVQFSTDLIIAKDVFSLKK